MKIEFSLEADTAAELLTALQNFVHVDGIGEKKAVKKSYTEETEDEPVKKPVKKATEDEEEPKKKPVKKVVEEEAEDKPLTHEDARSAIIGLSKKLEWDPAPPKIQAFTKKFAKKHDLTEDDGETHISRIPQIPVKKLKAFMEAIKEEGEI